jgi:hypothetical protein
MGAFAVHFCFSCRLATKLTIRLAYYNSNASTTNMSAGAMIGVWVGNGLVVLGVLLLAVRVYIARTLARMRHVQTGQPIPAPAFFPPNYLDRFLPARPQKPGSSNPIRTSTKHH